MSVGFILLVSVLIGCGQAACAASDSVQLKGRGLELSFGRVGKSAALTSLRDSSGEWLTSAGPADIWKLEIKNASGVKTEITSSSADIQKMTATGSRAQLVWLAATPAGKAEVTVNISLAPTASLSYWEISAKLPDGCCVARVDFPHIPNVERVRGLTLAAPHAWGLQYRLNKGTHYFGHYPSITAAMQFYALNNGLRGLYIASNDPEGYHKELSVDAADAVSCNTRVFTPNEPGRSWKLPYKAVVGTYTGDYARAAAIYREFLPKTPWGKAAPVSKRVPRWMQDVDLWLMPDADPIANVASTKKALDFFGAKTALHWYRWHQIPYDTLYPEYFPPKEGFAEGIRQLQDAGAPVMPYVNGRLCDPNSETWKSGGEQAAARDESGKPYTEVYGSKVPLNAMCPYTQFWQDKIASIVRRLFNEDQVNAVYIDQIGAAYPVQCFATNHGHAPGGGDFWVEGYRKMLDRIRAEMPAGRAITTEENAECWTDQFDAQLLVNMSQSSSVTPVPLYPLVYGGKAVSFGFQYIVADDIPQSLPWRAKMGRAFVFGSQVGWVSVERIMQPDAVREAEFLRNLARARSHAHDFVVDGRIVGLLNLKSRTARLQATATAAFGGTYKVNVDPLLGSLWQNASGKSYAVLACNLTDEPRTAVFTLPADLPNRIAAEAFGPDGRLWTKKLTSRELALDLPPRGAVVVTLEP